MEDLDARLLQLGAHEDRQRAADDAREDREDQVQRADVLVVGREEPALKEGQRLVGVVMVVPVIVGMVMKVVVLRGCSGHWVELPLRIL